MNNMNEFICPVCNHNRMSDHHRKRKNQCSRVMQRQRLKTPDDVHLTPYGYYEIGREFADVLLQQFDANNND